MAEASLGVGFVDVLPRTDKFVSSMTTQMQGAFSKVSSALGTTSTAVTATTLGFAALGGIMVKVIGDGIAKTQEFAASVRTLQRVTGASAEDTSKLAAAGEVLNLSTDKLNTGFGIFSKNVVSSNVALEHYGITTRDVNGQVLPFFDLLGNVQDAFAKLKPGPEQAAFAMKLFGRSGKEMIPILQRGREGMQELYDEAVKLGLVMSQEDLDASKELSIAQRELGHAFEGASISLGKTFIPLLTGLVEGATKAVEAFTALPGPVVAFTEAVIVLGGVLAGARLAFGALSFAFGPLIKAIQAKVVADGEVVVSSLAAARAIDAEGAAVARTTFLMGKAVPASTAAAGSTAASAGIWASIGAAARSAAGFVGLFAAAYTFLGASTKPTGDNLQRINDITFLMSQNNAVAKASVDGINTSFGETVPQLEAFNAGAREEAIALGASGAALDRAVRKGIDYSTALDEITAKANKTVELHGRLRNTLEPLGPIFDQMGISAEDFVSSYNDALATDKVDEWAAAMAQKSAEAWNAFKSNMQSALTFTDDALSDVEAKADEAGRKLTGSDILGAFDKASVQTKQFGSDLLEVSKIGGQAGKDLAASLAESGDVMAAQVIADSPAKLQRQIVGSFGASGKAADTFSTRLTNAIVGPLEDIQAILIQIATQGFGIDVVLDDHGAKAQLDNIKAGLNALPASKVVDIILRREGSIPNGGWHGGFVTPTGIRRFATGGSVQDTVPAMLAPGEFVMRRSAVRRIGVGNLRAMNEGGTVGGDGVAQAMTLDGATVQIVDSNLGLIMDGVLDMRDAHAARMRRLGR